MRGIKKRLSLQSSKRELLLQIFGPVVQLVRISACHAEGREFESRPDRKKPLTKVSGFFILGKAEFAQSFSQNEKAETPEGCLAFCYLSPHLSPPISP